MMNQNNETKMQYYQELRALLGHRPLIFVAAQVLIFDEQHRLLMLRRADNNKWDCPGGYIEPGESTEETARREILEETGLEIGNLTLFNVFAGSEFFNVYPNGDQVFPVSVVYVTNDVRGSLRHDGQESSELKYFPINDLPCEVQPQIRLIIERFLRAKGM